MRKEKVIGVLLVDDINVLRKTIATFIAVQSDIDLIATTHVVNEEILQLLQRLPSVILLGLRDGTRGDIERLQKTIPNVPIILMGLLENTSMQALTPGSGIDSYIDKSVLVTELVPEIRKLANRKK